MTTNKDIESRFEVKELNPGELIPANIARKKTSDLARNYNELLPEGRYKSLALTALEEASMWATKAVTHGN